MKENSFASQNQQYFHQTAAAALKIGKVCLHPLVLQEMGHRTGTKLKQREGSVAVLPVLQELVSVAVLKEPLTGEERPREQRWQFG